MLPGDVLPNYVVGTAWYCRYDAIMDEYLEESYRSYKQRQGLKGDTAKKRRRRLGAGGELSDEEGAEGADLELPERGQSSEDEEEEVGNGERRRDQIDRVLHWRQVAWLDLALPIKQPDASAGSLVSSLLGYAAWFVSQSFHSWP
jgi:hypothetical protein